MLITSNLPININKFVRQDQILTITGADWNDYQQFQSQEYPGYRVSFFKGEITIVSPGRNHERIAEVINRLIIAYCEKYEIQDFPFRQTRLNSSNQAGREPDIAYSFNVDKELPDLAVEVIFSSGNIEALKNSYLSIGICELWVWKDKNITFYYLEQNQYSKVDFSRTLPKIHAKDFIKYANRGIAESPYLIKKDFLKSI